MKSIIPSIFLTTLIGTSMASAALALPNSSIGQKALPSSSIGQKQPGPRENGQIRPNKPSTQPIPSPPVGSKFVQRCGEGEIPSTWEKPIYDQQGLFVIDWETVSICIPEDLEPAG